jgi:hypothetical protein
MYIALATSWSLFCGTTRYLSLATAAFHFCAPLASNARISPLAVATTTVRSPAPTPADSPALLAWMLASKVTGNAIGTRPALQLGVLLVVVAVQMVSLGLLAELVVNLRRRRRLEASADGDLLEP